MASCSRCGEPVEFRYIDGRPIPLHQSGGCGQGGGSAVRDFSGSSISKESECFLTTCPECKRGVYYIRHNGGCVWIDPPLGWPWYKHECMDKRPDGVGGARRSLVSADTLASLGKGGEALLGVVKAAETSLDGTFTIIEILTGADETVLLLVKNSAGFLVGRLVIVDPDGAMVWWIENPAYAFRVLAPLRVPAAYVHDSAPAQCPECGNPVRLENLGKHLERVHDFAILRRD